MTGTTYRGWTPAGPGRTVRQTRVSATTKRSRGSRLSPAYHYQIRVAGIVPPDVLPDLDHLHASAGPAETTIHSELPDQAALCGLLARLEMSGARVLEVHRLQGRTRQVRRRLLLPP
jgi:hypothetical protein